MGRLIDAKRLIKSLEDWNRNDDMDKALYNFAMNRVIEQPTAYDVEAVVKQIEDASVELYGFAKVVGLDKVIELVRNGGVK